MMSTRDDLKKAFVGALASGVLRGSNYSVDPLWKDLIKRSGLDLHVGEMRGLVLESIHKLQDGGAERDPVRQDLFVSQLAMLLNERLPESQRSKLIELGLEYSCNEMAAFFSVAIGLKEAAKGESGDGLLLVSVPNVIPVSPTGKFDLTKDAKWLNLHD